jgi:raffinose/stachyose/melibiose transport system substrate-binding protein
MKKLKALSLLLALTLAAAAGCGSSNQAEKDPAGSGGTKTIKFMHLWPEGTNAPQNKILNEIIADFERENPGIKIEQEILANEQYKDKIKVLSASNQLPDVGMAWPGGWLQPYVEGNKIASFDDVIDSDYRNKFVDGTIEAFEVDGKTYGLPTDLNIAIVYYNCQRRNSFDPPAPE